MASTAITRRLVHAALVAALCAAAGATGAGRQIRGRETEAGRQAREQFERQLAEESEAVRVAEENWHKQWDETWAKNKGTRDAYDRTLDGYAHGHRLQGTRQETAVSYAEDGTPESGEVWWIGRRWGYIVFKATFTADGQTSGMALTPDGRALQNLEAHLPPGSKLAYEFSHAEDSHGRTYISEVRAADGLGVSRVRLKFNEHGVAYWGEMRDEDGRRTGGFSDPSLAPHEEPRKPLIVPAVMRPVTGVCDACRAAAEAYNDAAGRASEVRAQIQAVVDEYLTADGPARDPLEMRHEVLSRQWAPLAARARTARATLDACLKTCATPAQEPTTAIGTGAAGAAAETTSGSSSARVISSLPSHAVTPSEPAGQGVRIESKVSYTAPGGAPGALGSSQVSAHWYDVSCDNRIQPDELFGDDGSPCGQTCASALGVGPDGAAPGAASGADRDEATGQNLGLPAVAYWFEKVESRAYAPVATRPAGASDADAVSGQSSGPYYHHYTVEPDDPAGDRDPLHVTSTCTLGNTECDFTPGPGYDDAVSSGFHFGPLVTDTGETEETGGCSIGGGTFDYYSCDGNQPSYPTLDRGAFDTQFQNVITTNSTVNLVRPLGMNFYDGPPPSWAARVAMGLRDVLAALFARTRPPAAAARPFAAEALRPGALVRLSSPAEGGPVEISLVATGESTGHVFTMQASGGQGPTMKLFAPDGLVVQAIRHGAARAVADRTRSALHTGTITGFCLDFAKPPPPAGTLYRVAPPEVQAALRPLRHVASAAQKLFDGNLLHPDSTPASYLNFVKQWSIWTAREHWDLKTFGDAFIERTKKNFAELKRPWSPNVEQILRRAVPNRWRDIEAVLKEAGPMLAREQR
jgi:hypothetical protein